MEQRLTYVTLGVQNLEAAENFYVNQLGWTKADNSNEDIIFIQLNGIVLSLFPVEELAKDATVGNTAQHQGFKGFTLAHNVRSEAAVDQLFQDFITKGITIIKHPEKVFWGGYSGYIADPDGYLWEIAYNPFLSLDEKGNAI